MFIYEFFFFFLAQTYFNGIKKMLTPEMVKSNGQLGASMPDTSIRRGYISVPGTGLVFATLVKEFPGSDGGGESAYVPGYTISCSPTLWKTNCEMFGEYHIYSIHHYRF